MLKKIAIGITVFVTSCSTSAFQPDLLKTIDAEGFKLIEIGSYAKMRILDLGKRSFDTRTLSSNSLLVGVSQTGDDLIMSAQSPYARRREHRIDIVTVQGRIVTTVQPLVRVMTVLYAELSPDRSMIAFVGGCTDHNDIKVTYGLHVLDMSGEVQTLVRTSEDQEPRSIGWSRDGTLIVYDSSERVFTYNVGTHTSTFVVDGSYPAWSPDGSRIAFRRPNGTAALVRSDGTESKSILDSVQLRAGLRWSPDGRYLLFTDAGGIKVLDLPGDRIATVFVPIDQYTDSRLRWVRGLPE